MMGADLSLVTVGRSLTVANGFSPLYREEMTNKSPKKKSAVAVNTKLVSCTSPGICFLHADGHIPGF